MSADAFSSQASSFGAYDRLSEEYRSCVIRCQQAADQLRACEQEIRQLGRPLVGVEPEFPGLVYNLGINIGRLSARELEVFTLIGCGLTTPQIARNLGVTTSTIETFRERLKAKLNIANGATLTRQAVLWFSRN